MNWSNRHSLLAGLSLIVLVNAIALAGVAWNRSEPADSRLQVSERELSHSYPYWRQDNSGIALLLNYRWPNSKPNDYSYDSLRQLSPEQMHALGFKVPSELNDESVRHYRRQLDRDGLLVLEFNGPLYQQQLHRAREQLEKSRADLAAVPDNKQLIESHKLARETLQREQTSASRLFVIDAGSDMANLRTRYPDRQRYAIVRGCFDTWAWHDDGRWQIGGSAQVPVAANIYLPQRWHALFAELPRRPETPGFPNSGGEKLFNAELAFGQRLEPWLVEFSAGKPE
ncbi:MAG: DUF4824 domain-containing protein [Pseudomonas sp. PGPPP3]|nr:MAG: DUF4824 domain-containing protein [Pseudomonas sp. PGPPP3]